MITPQIDFMASYCRGTMCCSVIAQQGVVSRPIVAVILLLDYVFSLRNGVGLRNIRRVCKG